MHRNIPQHPVRCCSCMYHKARHCQSHLYRHTVIPGPPRRSFRSPAAASVAATVLFAHFTEVARSARGDSESLPSPPKQGRPRLHERGARPATHTRRRSHPSSPVVVRPRRRFGSALLQRVPQDARRRHLLEVESLHRVLVHRDPSYPMSLNVTPRVPIARHLRAPPARAQRVHLPQPGRSRGRAFHRTGM